MSLLDVRAQWLGVLPTDTTTNTSWPAMSILLKSINWASKLRQAVIIANSRRCNLSLGWLEERYCSCSKPSVSHLLQFRSIVFAMRYKQFCSTKTVAVRWQRVTMKGLSQFGRQRQQIFLCMLHCTVHSGSHLKNGRKETQPVGFCDPSSFHLPPSSSHPPLNPSRTNAYYYCSCTTVM